MMINADSMVACIKAFLDPKVISHDGEFHTVVGRSRNELREVFAHWPVADLPTKEQMRLARQATVQLMGYPHRQFEYIEDTYGLTRTHTSLLRYYWRGWRDGENPAEAQPLREQPWDLRLWGESPSYGTRPGAQKPLNMRVDPDILAFFKESGVKTYERRIHAVLRAYVDAKKS